MRAMWTTLYAAKASRLSSICLRQFGETATSRKFRACLIKPLTGQCETIRNGRCGVSTIFRLIRITGFRRSDIFCRLFWGGALRYIRLASDALIDATFAAWWDFREAGRGWNLRRALRERCDIWSRLMASMP